MAPTTSIPRAERAMERLDLLARVGAVGDGGGITRPGLSAAEDAAHTLVAGWCEEAGMAVSRDAAGNLYARPGGAVAGAEIWSGSHLDTVPSGGRFDGALGVVAALEAVAAVAAVRPRMLRQPLRRGRRRPRRPRRARLRRRLDGRGARRARAGRASARRGAA